MQGQPLSRAMSLRLSVHGGGKRLVVRNGIVPELLVNTRRSR
jgi:hypothetical protein